MKRADPRRPRSRTSGGPTALDGSARRLAVEDQSAPSQLFAERARTFSFAARFLPASERRAVETLYAFCRLIDDLVDEPALGRSSLEIRAELDDWDAWLAAGAAADGDHWLRPRLATVIQGYDLPPACLRHLIEGQIWDLERRAFGTVRDLEAYC